MLHGCPPPHTALLLSDILSPAYTARSLRPPKGQGKMRMPAKMLSHHHCLTCGTFPYRRFPERRADAHLLAVLSTTHCCYQQKPTASPAHCHPPPRTHGSLKVPKEKEEPLLHAWHTSTPMCSVLQRLHPQSCCCTDSSYQLSRAQCGCLFSKNSSFCFLLCKEGLLGGMNKLQQEKKKKEKTEAKSKPALVVKTELQSQPLCLSTHQEGRQHCLLSAAPAKCERRERRVLTQLRAPLSEPHSHSSHRGKKPEVLPRVPQTADVLQLHALGMQR